MERKIITTADGSKTIHLPEWDEQYHSKHGAVQEAYHVFIKMGLHFLIQKNVAPIHILEIGFGTGLNAFITFLESKKSSLEVKYTGVEAFPVNMEEIKALEYQNVLPNNPKINVFEQMHLCEWEKDITLDDFFILKKQQKNFEKINDQELYDLVYFDAFGARVQPELWTENIFLKMFNALKPEGTLVTYSAKGSVRRAMQAVGFVVERLPGPPGKREMLRAIKNG